MLLTNTAEGGTNGANVTQGVGGNSGGASGAFFDQVTFAGGTGGLLTFDNAHAAHGTLAYKHAIGVTVDECYYMWSTALGGTFSRLLSRVNFYVTANPGTTHKLISILGGATLAARVSLNTTGKLVTTDTAGTTVATSTNSVPLNQWFRVEFDVTGSTTAGVITCRLYSNADDSTPLEVLSNSAQNTGTVALDRMRVGPTGTAVASVTVWSDDPQIGDPVLGLRVHVGGQQWRRRFRHRQRLLPVTTAVDLTQTIDQTGAGIPSGEAVGSSTLTPGAVTIAPAAIDASGPVGQSTLTQTLAPAGIDATSPVGQTTVTPVITPAGVATAEVVGVAVLAPGTVTVSPAAIDASSPVGQSTVAIGVSPASAATTDAVGQSTLTPGAVTLGPAGITTGEQVGQTVVAALGAPLNPASMGTAEMVGQSALTTSYTLAPAGIATGQTVGNSTLTSTLAPFGIDGSTAPGQATLAQAVAPVGVTSSQAVGVSTLVPGAVTLTIGGIPTAERVGQSVLAAAGAPLNPAGIPTSQAVGYSTLTLSAPPLGGTATGYRPGVVTATSYRFLAPEIATYGVGAPSAVLATIAAAHADSYPTAAPSMAGA